MGTKTRCYITQNCLVHITLSMAKVIRCEQSRVCNYRQNSIKTYFQHECRHCG